MLKRYLKTSSRKITNKHSIILDVGTTGVKAFVFDAKLNLLVKAYKRLGKKYPDRGWVEQDPKEFLVASQKVLREVVEKSALPFSSFAAIGITNQRETTVCWNKKNGKALYPAIVWEDARTKRFCWSLKKKYEKVVNEKTGLSIDPYFSASKLWWILKNVPQSSHLVEKNEFAFGTVDSWIMWNFLKNKPHLTDYTNASRTLLLNTKTLRWDKKLLDIFGIPVGILPQILPSKSLFGNLKKEIIGFSLPVWAVCGDQQASLYAAGTVKGTTKVTYGTGIFVMQVLGKRFTTRAGFFTTLIPDAEQPLYALEMKIDYTGERVEKLLHKKASLYTTLKKITREIDDIIKKLPMKPKIVITDGGIIRDKRIVSLQAAVSGIVVKPQSIFDGTALGVAKLIS